MRRQGGCIPFIVLIKPLERKSGKHARVSWDGVLDVFLLIGSAFFGCLGGRVLAAFLDIPVLLGG
jgi:hypothetical protein